MNVTAFVAIVSRARGHILRLTSPRLQDLVVSDWAARLVLRYWRLQRSGRQVLRSIQQGRLRPSTSLGEHALVLALGVVLVVPLVTGRSTATHIGAAEYSGYVLWTSSAQARNAAQMREINKASTLEERPAPAPPDPAPRPAAVRRPVFTPPPGSGGDGLAAIYAVFGNSPGLSWALRVANCESHYNPLAVNRYSGASGLFQFMPSTWNANFPGQNIWDPYAQARAALVFYNAGRQSAWTCK